MGKLNNKQNNDFPRDLEAFISALTDQQRILSGGSVYEGWATDLLQLCLKHHRIVEYGAVLVPQLGSSAGDLFPINATVDIVNIDKERLHTLLKQFWEDRTLDARSISYGVTKSGVNLVCVFSPISYGFDRPIGYFWALVSEIEQHKVERILYYASILISICVRAEKACYAIQQLSKPIYGKIKSVYSAAKHAADLCLEVLSCKTVIVWKVNKNENLLCKIVSSGIGSENIKVDMELGVGVAGRCAMDNKLILIDDLWKEPTVAHPDVIREKGFRSGLFIPLDEGGEILGVLGAYGKRPNAFSELDADIASSIAQWLVTIFIQQSSIEDTLLIKKKIDKEMTLIEAGILAMARVHDARNKLYFAQNDLSMITSRYFPTKKDSQTYKDALSASKHIDDSLNIISALVRRAKLTKQHLKNQSLTELINKILKDIENQRSEYSINIQFNQKDDIRLKFDRSQMERVFMNLIDNSFHFLSQSSGKREILINIKESNTKVEIIFRDNGPGIAPYDLKNVFDVFFTTKGDRGLGFGLPIVKSIIEDHEGNIEVSSIWGDFTEFQITLPKE